MAFRCHPLTVCSREMTGSESLRAAVALLNTPASSAGPGRQGALAIPTIWPWMAVPRTVPRSSTVIPGRRKMKRRPEGYAKGILLALADVGIG